MSILSCSASSLDVNTWNGCLPRDVLMSLIANSLVLHAVAISSRTLTHLLVRREMTNDVEVASTGNHINPVFACKTCRGGLDVADPWRHPVGCDNPVILAFDSSRYCRRARYLAHSHQLLWPGLFVRCILGSGRGYKDDVNDESCPSLPASPVGIVNLEHKFKMTDDILVVSPMASTVASTSYAIRSLAVFYFRALHQVIN